MDSLDTLLDALKTLHPKLIDLSLGRTQALLAKLGHPERRLPPVIHVAGTNGKGSVTAYLAAMLRAAGKRVHVYTSPHLVRFNERIRLGAKGGGSLVNDAELGAGQPLSKQACFLESQRNYLEEPAEPLLEQFVSGERFRIG